MRSIQSVSQNVCIVVRSLQTYPAPCLHYHIMAVRTLNCKKRLLARLPIVRVLDYPKCRQFQRENRDSSVGIEISLREVHLGSIRSRGNMLFPSPKHPYGLPEALSSCSMGTWGTVTDVRGFRSGRCFTRTFLYVVMAYMNTTCYFHSTEFSTKKGCFAQ
jgi:hypothetical protein